MFIGLALTTLSAYAFTITAQRGPTSDPVLILPSDTNAYFQIHAATAPTGSYVVVDMELGIASTHTWTDVTFLTTTNLRTFYKVRGIPLQQSLDEDADGMPDVFELQWPFLNPLDPADAQQDEDGDALFNLGEYLFGTDPTDRDTDKDWVLDGYEVVQGTDPADPASTPPFEFRVNNDDFCISDTNLQVDFGPFVADEAVISETPDLANSVTAALPGIVSFPVSSNPNGWRAVYARLRRTSDSAETELLENRYLLDTAAPQISGVMPTNGTVTTQATIQMEGFAIDAVGPVQVLVDGGYADGVITSYFHRGAIALTNGLNLIDIVASDCAGHATTQTLSITRSTSGTNAPPAIVGNVFPQTHWDGIYSNAYSSLAYFNGIPQWDTEDGWRLYRDEWAASINQLKEVLKQSVTTCTYVPSPNCITDNATDTSISSRFTPVTFAAFGSEAVWVNRVSTHLPAQEWNRETFTYRDVLTFLPSNQTENVIIKFIGMGYRRPPGQSVVVNLITYRGSTGFVYQGEVAFNATITPGVPLKISASDFTWPEHTYLGTRFDRRLIYGSSTKTKAHLLWFDSVQFFPP